VNLTQLYQSTIFGNILNTIGIVIALIGFAATIIVALRAKKAAQQAREAANNVRKDIRIGNTVAQFAEVLTIMDEIKDQHRAVSWDRPASWYTLPVKYSAVCRLLASIQGANPELSRPDKTALTSAINQFTTMQRLIDEALIAEEDLQQFPNIAELNEIVNECTTKLRKISVTIQNTIGV